MTFFLKIKNLDIDGVILSDLTALNVALKYKINNKIVYNPDTLITNHLDYNYFKKFNLKGCFISPSITLEDLNKINEEKKYSSFFIGFGYINIFNSRRPLLSLYYEQNNLKKFQKKLYNNLFIKEETRDELMPIYEDKTNTYIFTSEIFNATNFISQISGLDYFIFDTIFLNSKQIKNIMTEFKESNNIINKLDNLTYSSHFLFKKIGYRK